MQVTSTNPKAKRVQIKKHPEGKLVFSFFGDLNTENKKVGLTLLTDDRKYRIILDKAEALALAEQMKKVENYK